MIYPQFMGQKSRHLTAFLDSLPTRDPDACWPWPGKPTSQGYCTVRVDGSTPQKAHRVVYELLVGPIPAGKQIDHVCHTPNCRRGATCPHRACCNPAHLLPSTGSENYYRTGHTTKTHCPEGHPYAGENLYLNPKHPSYRGCRTCRKARTTAYNDAVRATRAQTRPSRRKP